MFAVPRRVRLLWADFQREPTTLAIIVGGTKELTVFSILFNKPGIYTDLPLSAESIVWAAT